VGRPLAFGRLTLFLVSELSPAIEHLSKDIFTGILRQEGFLFVIQLGLARSAIFIHANPERLP
jgi:hypothetical protein